MEKLTFDSGIRSFKVNGGAVLRFNPGDPNVYGRFLAMLQELEDMEQTFAQPASGEGALDLLVEADGKLKQKLGQVFPGNDFAAIFQGVNLLAVGSNGHQVIENFLQALEPILTQGAKRCADGELLRAKQARAAR